MVLSAALTADLFTFFDSVGLDPAVTADAADDIHLTLREVVPTCLGFQFDLVDNGVTVSLTSFEPSTQAGDIATSLHVPLLALGFLRLPPTAAVIPARFDPRSALTLYGSRAGAFVDLAADLTYALRSASRGSSGPANGMPSIGLGAVTLDQHLTPSSTSAGVVGAHELSTVNRALGYLIGQGHDPELALGELGRRAAAAGLTVLVYAAQLLGR